jgi:hypothetical protein
MAQNVGPILEMVTEKYLLRSPAEWKARQEAIEILDQIVVALNQGDIRAVGQLTHKNFFGPLQKIIPWCTNLFTNSLVEKCQVKYGEQFWGFWMLGGMAGGGMGFIFDPSIKQEAQAWLQTTMVETKRGMESRLPFAMDPVVYDLLRHDGTDVVEGTRPRAIAGFTLRARTVGERLSRTRFVRRTRKSHHQRAARSQNRAPAGRIAG